MGTVVSRTRISLEELFSRGGEHFRKATCGVSLLAHHAHGHLGQRRTPGGAPLGDMKSLITAWINQFKLVIGSAIGTRVTNH